MMPSRMLAVRSSLFAVLVVAGAIPLRAQAAPQLIHVPLAYAAPGGGKPTPNFSPKGTQIALRPVLAGTLLPKGALLPARTGRIPVGPDSTRWIPVLVSTSEDHPDDLCQMWIDRNLDGNFTNDGPALTATPVLNEKTKAYWTSINKVELTVPYPATGTTEPYLVNFWMVREDSAGVPDILRYSVGSWRQGTVTVNGVPALVAAMDADNDAIFTAADEWSVLGAAEPSAERAVLSIAEARPTKRLMFIPGPSREMVLEFRGFSPDGRSIDFAVIDAPVTKAADRAPDDQLRDERPRPRATVPFTWAHGHTGFDSALAAAKANGHQLFLDFEATWCGPCHTMDEWIWTDAEVAKALNAGFIGVKLDADLEKALVKRFGIVGYPTMVILNADGSEARRVSEYQTSKQMLAFLAGKPPAD